MKLLSPLEWALLLVGLALQVLVINSMRKGACRAYPFVFTYCIVLFFTTALQLSAVLNVAHWQILYWYTDFLPQLLIYIIVIAAIYRASSHVRTRRWATIRLVLLTLFVVAVSLFFSRDENLNRWMTNFSRNINFAAVILNLLLWSYLIQSKQKDTNLLMIAGGLGIQLAGGAIGHSLRQLSPRTVLAGNLLLVLTHLICLYVWWWTFRQYERQEQAQKGQ